MDGKWLGIGYGHGYRIHIRPLNHASGTDSSRGMN
jgi:hypothetical protein